MMERLRRGGSEPTLGSLEASTEDLRRQLDEIQRAVASLTATMQAAQDQNLDLRKAWARQADERARIAAAPGPVPLGDSIELDGPPHRRVDVERLMVGDPVEVRFDAWMGVTRSVGASPDARAFWDHLLASEAQASGGVLRCAPSTILDAGAAEVSRTPSGTTRVSLREAVQPGPAIAVPRFTYHQMPRKLRNFGHWFLDLLPQAVMLSQVAPEARILLPESPARFHRATLNMVGIGDDRMYPWDGKPVTAERVLLLLHDGRFGGGRPLSSLVAMQKVLRRAAPAGKGRRRLYVSRRDAKARRRWLTNEDAIASLFESRGFEILVMKECPLDEQVRAFSDARIVAGGSGAGLSDLVFAAPGTHLIVLYTDSLLRWYADETSRRSHWAQAGAREGELAALGDSPRFYAHLAAALSQYCHSFLSADEVPIGELAAFLDEVLERVEKHP